MPQASPDFLTPRIDYRLFAALALSLSLHLVPLLPALLPDFNFEQNFRSTVGSAASVPLKAELRPPPARAAIPPLSLPEPPGPAVADKPAKPKPEIKSQPRGPTTWTQTVREHLKKLDKAGQFYPADAIAQGLEGEVHVLIIIDETGKVSAARVERGSGHALLDDAALRAARSLQSLPADAPREIVLPVRFRLR